CAAGMRRPSLQGCIHGVSGPAVPASATTTSAQVHSRAGSHAVLAGLVLLMACLSVMAEVLHRGTTAEPNSLDPHIATGAAAAPILYDLGVGLTTLDAEGRVVPGAAESWTVSEDGLVYTFTLRENLKWSDGSPLTAEDFLFSVRRVVDPATASRFASFFFPLENARQIIAGELPPESVGVEKVDQRTLVYRLVAPTPSFLETLASNIGSPVPRAMIEEHGRQWTRPGRLLSSGAYRLAEWVPNSHITLEANPYFYDADSVRIPQVRYYPGENQATGLRRYRSGQLDILLNFPSDEADWIERNLPGHMQVYPALAVNYLLLNLERPPFDDWRVRKALSISIDREGLVERLITPGSLPAYSLTPDAVAGYQPPRPDWADEPYAERVARARELLAEAGFDQRNPLRFEIMYDTLEENRRNVVALASMWRQIGVQASPVNVEFNQLNRAARTGDFSVLRYTWFAPNDDPDTFLGLLDSRNPNNHSGFRSEAYDSLLREGNARMDTESRMATLARAEAMMLAEQPVIPVFFYTRRFLVQPHVQGFVPNSRGLNLSRYLAIEGR
ncbi:MAG: peptide ABC transporter substrate-binding protein, partial [Chromatiales bacterium]|nr:peptide ABC transporter substrate-binding protein [Chromatiales bacterium]